MNFDSKIIIGFEPISCFNQSKALENSGELGYFSNNLSAFRDIANSVESGDIIIDSFHGIDRDGFFIGDNHKKDLVFQYFLPAKWVKRNIRAFTTEEFLKLYPVGSEIQCQSIYIRTVRSWVVIGTFTHENISYVLLKHAMIPDGRFVTLQWLSEHECIVTKDGRFLPIGIEVEE